MNTCSEWYSRRTRFLRRLSRDIQENNVDNDIVSFLIEFNKNNEEVFTTSSCSGRIVILSGNDIFNKASSNILFSWHDPRKCNREIMKIQVRSEHYKYVWISIQPPILHIMAKTENLANKLVKCGNIAGFARSCYKKHRSCGYHVEIAGHDKFHIILPASQEILSKACIILEKYKNRLNKLTSCLLKVVREG